MNKYFAWVQRARPLFILCWLRHSFIKRHWRSTRDA